MKCFEYLLKGKGIVAVLRTDFGKSLLFQLLPDFLPVKVDNDIVLGLISPHDFYGSWHLYICCFLFGHLFDLFVASLVFMNGTSCCVLRRNFRVERLNSAMAKM